MANTNDYFGFELLNKLVDNKLNKKEDVLILFAHWFFIKNGFKCIGLGDSKTVEANVEGNELLPEEWNQKDHYSLRYLKEGQLYILLGRKSDNNLLLNLLRVDDNGVSNVKFQTETIVNSIHGPLATLIPTYQEVMNKIREDLVEPVYTGTAREMSTQTTQNESQGRRLPNSDNDPLRVGPPHIPQRPPRWDPASDPRAVGRADLDPFAGVGPRGGGMIFDPFQQDRNLPNPRYPHPNRPGGLGGPAFLPPGAVPPGARFDPFGPPDNDLPRPSRRNPDHDHLPPPGYDDMFM
ncbi:proteasome inhibitor PI31 subunit [Microplitis demolitor]|uniref:proteasome inhibitor PI31 subunit n=1 Tax=Microplitis demolitor TaxID=69319 RepID=UPI0004CD0265|nr:proteasome inhibitor PI31 subunit [Microplitis demolitor]